MSKGITVKRIFCVGRKVKETSTDDESPVSLERVPRISRLMALAIRFDKLIEDGAVADQAELAGLGHVSRARLTQIMNLLNLAPDIQESLITLTSSQNGRDGISERQLRPVAAQTSWRSQRLLLSRLQLSTVK